MDRRFLVVKTISSNLHRAPYPGHIGLGSKFVRPFPPLLMRSEAEQLLGFLSMKSHIVWDDPIYHSQLQILTGTLKIAHENNKNE
ncbi:hypothetical protein Y032_0058g2842 [Ancylostoma ceylanicum]|uniref:Uncharacterized protein n=1 Tax=Ancylostoma ceylanicum TaxID=53326 RepID=A0A016U3F4_9BILA|nr:hypothetical protein Y032_0058g2842 [Ancylostoma ceylanicum]